VPVKNILKKALLTLGYEIQKVDSNDKHKIMVSLGPSTPPSGRVLLAYVIDPFLLKDGEPVQNHHTNCWESLQIAKTYLDLGYSVDAISFRNEGFTPSKEYSIFIAARTNFKRVGERLNKDCFKIVHLDTAHWLFNNCATYGRCMALKERRGVALEKSMRFVELNMAIEFADCASMLGNGFTLGTYSYARKPIHPLPVPTVNLTPWSSEKRYDLCRKSFLWFGSSGFVHKGLDLVLEAFVEMSDHHLTICGPIDQEEEFKKVYQKELYQTPNIHTHGWVDVSSSEFEQIVNQSVGLVYPSCSEGQAGAVVTCLQGGLIPIVSYESGVDVNDFGVVLGKCTKETIKEAVYEISNRPPRELECMARKAWEYARENHTREKYSEVYRRFAERVQRGHLELSLC
jgi:hypothetical protein